MFFEKKIDTSSKESVAEFLLHHYRYNTASSWNRSTSYANCVKVDRIGLTGSSLQKAFELVSIDGLWGEISTPIREFEHEMMGAYTIGSNGRSGGYLVLYEAEIYDPGYKSTCPSCGQLNYQPVTQGSHTCGVCRGERKNLKAPLRWTRAKTSAFDHGMTMEDFMDMSFAWLKDRADLVRSFDRACDRVRSAFIGAIEEYMVIEETVMVPTRVRRLERA